MIMNLVQKNVLANRVEETFKTWSTKQSHNSGMVVVDGCTKYKVETDGDIIMFHDFVEDEISIFDTAEEFRSFIFKHY